MSFTIESIAHVSVIVADTEKSLDFYCGLLGLSVNHQRPDLGYPGAWLTIADQEIHLLQLPNPDPTQGRPAHGGRDRHLAMHVTNLTDLKESLDNRQIDYTASKSGRAAIFLRDPDGNALEIIEINVE